MKTLLAGLLGGLVVLAGLTFTNARTNDPTPVPTPVATQSETYQKPGCTTTSNVIFGRLDCEYRPAPDVHTPILLPTPGR